MAVIEPMVRSALFTTVMAPSDAPEAMVAKALLALDKVIALLPTKTRP